MILRETLHGSLVMTWVAEGSEEGQEMCVKKDFFARKNVMRERETTAEKQMRPRSQSGNGTFARCFVCQKKR